MKGKKENSLVMDLQLFFRFDENKIINETYSTHIQRVNQVDPGPINRSTTHIFPSLHSYSDSDPC